MKKIPLTQGKVAFIDDDDYGIVSLFKWHACKDYSTYYARSKVYVNNQEIYISMHGLVSNAKKGQMVDHINRNGLYNLKNNLRFCTNQQNQMNKMANKSFSSKYKGVSWHEGALKWRSQIAIDRKVINLGYFKSEVEAAKAYDKAALESFGEFALTNNL